MQLKTVDHPPQDKMPERTYNGSTVNGSSYQNSFQRISTWVRKRKETERRRKSISSITNDMEKPHTPTFSGASSTPVSRSSSLSDLTANLICLDFYSTFVQNLCFSISSVPNPLEIYSRFNSFQPNRFLWLKDGRPVVTTEKISVSFTVHSSLLRVDRPEQDSSGIYTCVVFHALGRSQASICILISPDPDEDEEIEEIGDVCADAVDDPHSEGPPLMDYRPIYRPSVLGTSNTTQRMVWNMRNYSATGSPLSPNSTVNSFLPTSTNASGGFFKSHSYSAAPSPDLNTEPEHVLDRDDKKGAEEQMSKGIKTSDGEAKGRTDSPTQPVKPAYLSWFQGMFRRKKAAVNNSNEHLHSKGSTPVLPPETKPTTPNVPTSINDDSVYSETSGKSSPHKMISRVVSSAGTSTYMSAQHGNPQSISSRSLTNCTDNVLAVESGNEKIDSPTNSQLFPTCEAQLATAAFQSTLADCTTEAHSSIYPKSSQSRSISSGMEECSEPVGTSTCDEEEEGETHHPHESTGMKLIPHDGFPPVNDKVEVISPSIVVSVVDCVHAENGKKSITCDPMQLSATDDESPYSSDVDKPHRQKHVRSKTPPPVDKELNGFLQPTLDGKTTPTRLVKSCEDMIDGGVGTGLGSSVSCDDGTKQISQKFNPSNSSVLSQGDSDRPAKAIPATDNFPDRARSFNTIQSNDHEKDRAAKHRFKKSSDSVTSEGLEWFSLGSKRRSMGKKSKYGTSDSVCFPSARSHSSLSSERGHSSGSICTPPKVSIRRKRDLLLVNGDPQRRRRLSSQSTGSAFSADFSEADSRNISAACSEVDSSESQGCKGSQHLNPPLAREEPPPIKPVLVNGVNAEVPHTVLKRPDFESAFLRTDHEGDWTGPNRSRLEGVQLLVAKYEQSARSTSSVESLTDSGVCKSTSEQSKTAATAVNHEQRMNSVPCLSRADKNRGMEAEQLGGLKSPPAVDRRRNREFTLSVGPTEGNSAVVGPTDSVNNKSISQETLTGSPVGTPPSQLKSSEVKVKKDVTGVAAAPRVPVLPDPPNSPQVSQSIWVALSQTRAGSIEDDKKRTSTPVIAGEKSGPQVMSPQSKPLGDTPPPLVRLRSPADLVSPITYRKHGSEESQLHTKKLTRSQMVFMRPNLSHILHKEEEKPKFTPDPQTHKNIDPASHFTMLEQLGKGKFGKVNRCQKKDTNQVLAVKVVRTARLRRDQHGDVMEVAILRAIGYHDSIACLFSAYEYKNECYIFSEYVSGGALFDRIVAEDNLDEKICASIIRQLLLGLQHIQQCSILHLDLKPENVMMVAPTGYRLKIIDFGLACFHNPAKPSRSVGGTFTYSAPETINYEYQDFSTDTWSVAVIAYEVLSGITPFEIPQTGDPEREMSMAEITTNIINCKYHFNDPGICDATDMAKEFIQSILKRNPSDRPTVETCLKHEWMMTSEDLPTVKRTVSLRRRNTAKERVRPLGLERCQTSVGIDEVCRT